jgi:hypothetical protein
LTRTFWLLVCADDVYLLGHNISTTKKNIEVLIDARNEDGMEVNTERTKYMLMSSPECRAEL